MSEEREIQLEDKIVQLRDGLAVAITEIEEHNNEYNYHTSEALLKNLNNLLKKD